MVISFQRIGASMILEVINTLTFLSIHLHLIDLDKAFIMRVEPCKILNRLLGNSFVEIMVSVKHLVGCHPAWAWYAKRSPIVQLILYLL
jgi:hypothetical protein